MPCSLREIQNSLFRIAGEFHAEQGGLSGEVAWTPALEHVLRRIRYKSSPDHSKGSQPTALSESTGTNEWIIWTHRHFSPLFLADRFRR